jgi:3'-5' exoribonuclease
VSSETRTRIDVKDLTAGNRVEDQIFLIHEKDFRTSSNGSAYIHAILADSSGQMVARMWDASKEIFDSMPRGGYMRIRGRVESYRGKPQFIIEGTRTVDPETLDPAQFLPCTERDVSAMWDRVKEILRNIENPHLLAIVGKFINDEQFAQRFMTAPAAAALHHAYLGGLLEHTLNLLELALLVMPRYPEVSQDLVLTGIFLHDSAKTVELTYDTKFGYSNEGQLIGHIVQCVLWIDQKAREIEAERGEPIPGDLLSVLKHIILAHHGTYEFGSPKLPAVPEAVAVHYIDNLDAKLHMFRHYIDSDDDDSNDWTQYIPAIQTKVFKKRVTD